ncbi:hypothetical protein GPECTOR_59g645 [Gonium pectorale]|uniref:Uncharacterized protein n=1 Tax=Gonium pectorale TaxID=33097 RepID=A0A150G5B7_GONPE|nr:hypothetical protein GPECTOR_59g645 [Gonium pectorale]|eukprot:KXZ45037.1 hypothetical protein GPECTOR_59g645 [Gonium pectorale]
MGLWGSHGPRLLPKLAEKIVGCLDPNEVPLVNKAAAAQFRAPHHTTYRLSQPVPPHAFAAHWLAPGATRGLTLQRRRQLLSLTAASGVVANLEVAVQAAGCLLTAGVLEAAAKAGQLGSCVWLWEHGCPAAKGYDNLLAAAASGGHRHVSAARGTVAAVEYLLLGEAGVVMDGNTGLQGVLDSVRARHLPVLRVLHAAGMAVDAAHCAVEAARNGHLHVLAWLVGTFGSEAVGMDSSLFYAAASSGSMGLMAWLRERGCGWDASASASAASSGCEEAVEWLVAQGCPVEVG